MNRRRQLSCFCALTALFVTAGEPLAQSVVSINGEVKVRFGTVKIGNPAGTRTGNLSETRIDDEGSAIWFYIREKLTSDLAAVLRVTKNTSLEGTEYPAGFSYIGLRSNALGVLVLGRFGPHAGHRGSNLTAKGSVLGDSVSLLARMRDGTPIAGAGYVANAIRYQMPSIGGFNLVAVYSTGTWAGPGAAEADLGSKMRKGYGINLAPRYEATDWTVGYSYWYTKLDNPASLVRLFGVITTSDQRGHRLFGSYRWRRFHVGLAWDRSELMASVPGAGVEGVNGGLGFPAGTTVAKRTVWSVPVEYTWGRHSIMSHYTKAGDDSATAGIRDGAYMVAVAYAYDLSKRTSIALTYAKIANDPRAQYHFHTTYFASPSLTVRRGESPRFLAGTMRFTF